jgi:DNA polymerase-1
MQTLVKDVMEQAIELNVPLKVDLNHGVNWYEAK